MDVINVLVIINLLVLLVFFLIITINQFRIMKERAEIAKLAKAGLEDIARKIAQSQVIITEIDSTEQKNTNKSRSERKTNK